MNQKHVFWEALIVAIFIFGVGILFGFWLENLRAEKVSELYAASELEMMDVKIHSDILDFEIADCSEAVENNIQFADKIYGEAIQLSKYENSNKLTGELILQHKKYDLLRTLLWVNSMKIKKACNSSYENVVYFYQYNEPSIEKKAMQGVFAKVLEDVKTKKENKIILIPIAGDNDISSVSFLMKAYGIKELPTVLIDEKVKLTRLESVQDIEKLLK